MSEALEQEIRILRARFWSKRDPEGRAFAPLADAYRRKGELDEALDLLEDGLDRLPDFATGHLVAARVHVARDNRSAAEEALGRLFELDSENASGLRLRGEMCEAVEDIPSATHAFRRALALNPAFEDLEGRIARLELGEAALDPEDVPFDDMVADAEDGTLDLDPSSLPDDPGFGLGVGFEAEADSDPEVAADLPPADDPAGALDEEEHEVAFDGPSDKGLEDDDNDFYFDAFSPEPPRDDATTEGSGEMRRPGVTDSPVETSSEDLDDFQGSERAETDADHVTPKSEGLLDDEVTLESSEEWAPLELEAGEAEVEPRPESESDVKDRDDEPGTASGQDQMEDIPRDFAMEGWDEEDPDDSADGDPEPSEPVGRPATVTRTLGELYARQGETDRAIEVFAELLERNPADDAIALRLAELRDAEGEVLEPESASEPEHEPTPERESASEPEPTPEPEFASEPAVGGPTVGGFLDDLLAWEPGAVPVEDLAPAASTAAFGDPEESPAWMEPVPVEDLAPGTGESAREAPAEEQPASTADAASEVDGSVSREEPPSPLESPGDEGAEHGDGDLDDFQAWLRSLRS